MNLNEWLRAIAGFFVRDFPRLFRKRIGCFLASLACFAAGMAFGFKRMDNGKAVRCRIVPDRMPSLPPEDANRLGGLLKKVLWEAAREDEIAEFRGLWRRNVAAVFESAKRGNQWLAIEEVK